MLDQVFRILVLLPVYNGSKYLAEQLDSIIGQSFKDVRILIRDDGSIDRSTEIIDAYVARYPGQVTVIHDRLGNVGASANFALLMQAALEQSHGDHETTGPVFYSFADQDDIWHEDKLESVCQIMRQHESRHPGTPAVVHSDLRVVAENGDEIAPSMAKYQGLQTGRDGFAAQVLSNTITGCTALVNRKMLETALPIPAGAIMHDWWISLVASALGHRYYLDRPLLDYRQHQHNTIGAREWKKPELNFSLLRRLFGHDHNEIFRLNARQANAFLKRYKPWLSWRQILVLRMAAQLDFPFPPLQKLLFRLLRKL